CGAVLVLTPEISDAASDGRVGVPVRVALGLGAIQLAVTLGWMAYAHFQPRILDDIGLSRLDTVLSVYVAAAGAILGPLAGGLADLTVRRAGSRFPVVVAGGFLAGVLFVAVALAIGPHAPRPRPGRRHGGHRGRAAAGCQIGLAAGFDHRPALA